MGLLWTPLPKGGLPSNKVPGICCGVGNGCRGLRCCHVRELDVADDMEGECGEASDG
jgi:hypothetical protein